MSPHRLFAGCLLLLFGSVVAACGEDTARRISPQIVVEVRLPDGTVAHETALSFGDVPVDDSHELELVVYSTTHAPLTLKDFSIVGESVAAKEFTVLDPEPGTLVAAGSEQTVRVRFQPSEARSYEAALEIASDDPKEPTVTVPLGGRGISSALRVMACLPATEAEPGRCKETEVEAPAKLDMGKVVIGGQGALSVTLDNRGRHPLIVHSVEFKDPEAAEAVGFQLPSRPSFPLEVKALNGQSMLIPIAPPEGSEGVAEVTLLVRSEDRNLPEVELPIAVEIAPNTPPLACLQIREVIRFVDGKSEVPEPGTVVEVSPADTVVIDGKVREDCSGDPEDGRNVTAHWTFDKPASGDLVLLKDGDDHLEKIVEPDVISEEGEVYEVSLEVEDSLGLTADADENGAPATVSFKVLPREDLAVEIRWPANAVGADIDLHFVRAYQPGNTQFTTHNDCYWDGPARNWGPSRVRLAVDDSGNGNRTETLLMMDPEHDTTYGVYVHFFQDNRGSAQAQPVEVSYRIYSRGEVIGTGVASLTQPCDTWLLGTVHWLDGDPGSDPQVNYQAGGQVAQEGEASGNTCVL